MEALDPIKRNKAYGPYEVIGEVNGEGRVFLPLTWGKVVGAQVLIAVKDNYARFEPTGATRQYWATAEVTIWGVIQSLPTCLKRQQVRMDTGPMNYVFPFEEAYDLVQFRARNMSGGRRGPPGVSGTDNPSAANGFSLAVSVFVMPRSGFG